jgi:hypothetical protein
MKNVRFVVKVNRGGRVPLEYVQRVDPAPIHMTTNPQAGTAHGKIHGGRCGKVTAKLSVQPRIGVRTGPCLKIEGLVMKTFKGS